MRVLNPKTNPSETFEANCLFGFLNVKIGLQLYKYDYLLTNIESGNTGAENTETREAQSAGGSTQEIKNNGDNIYIASITVGYDEVFIDHYLGSPNYLTKNIVNEVLNHCFTIKNKVVAMVPMENDRQRKMCERIGFKQEGTLRRYNKSSIIYYGFFVDEWNKSKYNIKRAREF